MTEKEFKRLGGVEVRYWDDPEDYYLQIETNGVTFVFDPKIEGEFYMYTRRDALIKDSKHLKLLLKAFKY